MVKCYIASPFFSLEQVSNVENVRNQLLALGIEVYSPKHDGIRVVGNSSDRARLAAYMGDVGAVRSSDFVLCIADYDDVNIGYDEKGEPLPQRNDRVFHGFDSGTIYECGLSRGFGIPIIFYFPSNVKINLMLTLAGHGYTTDISKVGELVQEVIIERKPFIKEKYTQEVKNEDKGTRFV